MKLRKNRILWLLLILVIISSVIFASKSWKNLSLWRSHQAYFKQPEEDRKIELWMTPRFIKHYYDLNEISALSGKVKFKDRGLPLEKLCEKRKLDCDEIVKEINKQISK